MDALSFILRIIRLQSSVYFRSDFSSPWGMEIDNSQFAQFHMIVRGNCFLGTENHERPLLLSAGDIIMFPFGEAHWLADDPSHDRLSGMDVAQTIKKTGSAFQGEQFSVTLICGHFEFDRSFDHPFIKALPRMIHIADAERRELSWLEVATKVIIQEANSNTPGAEVVVEKLTEVLFIQILRAYMLQKGGSQGYFAALKDQQISHALKLIHELPQESWTLENIAQTIGMSRSAFASRFKELVGKTPIEYMTHWRMNKARELLRQKDLQLLDIAEQVGYTSEAAFSRAFKRIFNQNPGAMRRDFFYR